MLSGPRVNRDFARIENDSKRRRCKEDCGDSRAHDCEIRGESFRWELFVCANDYSNAVNGERDVTPWMRAQNKIG